MTIASEVRRAGPYAGNGSTQVFAFSFKTFSQNDLAVVSTTAGVDTVLTLTTHYTVSLNGDQDGSPGGTVTILTAPAVGTSISILSDRSLLQALNVQNAGAFLPANVNNALDNIVIGLQQVSDQQARGVRGALSDPEWNRLPTAAERAGGLLGFDGSGQPIVADIKGVEAIATDVATVAGISSEIQIVAAADVDIGAVSDNMGDVITAAEAVRDGTLAVIKDTYAALTAIPAASRSGGMIVYVASRASDGDGGDGYWRFDAASSATADGGTILAPDAGTGRWLRQYDPGNIKPEWFATINDAVTLLNITGGILHLGASEYTYSTTLDLEQNGSRIEGVAAGNNSNLSPAYTGPSVLNYTGSGAAIRLRGQGCSVSHVRVTASGNRATDVFDIDDCGIRVEPDDTTGEAGRADRCVIKHVRIDKHPGDGILTVGAVTGFQIDNADVYECRGFGLRMDDGSLAGLVRTNKHYPGLCNIHHLRVGFCGGHAVAVSNPTVTVQAGMGIRIVIDQLDSFGNANNTSIMYASTDGKFYTVWIFGENCEIKNSAPEGRTWNGSAFVSEQRGGVWIAGRDNYLLNNRYIETSQPIYWGYISAQPSTGLVVDGVRLTQTSLVHDQLVQLESGSARGLHVRTDDKGVGGDLFTRFVGPQSLTASVGYQVDFRGQKSAVPRASGLVIADDAVAVIPIVGAAASATQQFVLMLAMSAVASGGGIFHCRCGSASPAVTKWAGETNTVAGSGALTGTTGADGNVTVSCDDTSLYIENRRGFSITLNYQLLAANSNSGLLA